MENLETMRARVPAALLPLRHGEKPGDANFFEFHAITICVVNRFFRGQFYTTVTIHPKDTMLQWIRAVANDSTNNEYFLKSMLKTMGTEALDALGIERPDEAGVVMQSDVLALHWTPTQLQEKAFAV